MERVQPASGRADHRGRRVRLLARGHVELGRADVSQTSSWRLTEEIRPVAAYGVAAVGGGGSGSRLGRARRLPRSRYRPLLRVDQVIKANAVVAFALACVSLRGAHRMGGQISLGQMRVLRDRRSGRRYVTSRWHIDLTLALLVGAATGAIAALAVGLPALRLQGLYLAVTHSSSPSP